MSIRHAIVTRSAVVRRSLDSTRFPSAWLSAPRVWIERLEARRVLSADGTTCDMVNEPTDTDPAIDVDPMFYQTGIVDFDDEDMGDVAPFYGLPEQDGATTIATMLNDQKVLVTIDADGNVTAADADGSAIDDAWADYDGSVYIDGALAEVRVVQIPAGGYGFVEGIVPDSIYSLGDTTDEYYNGTDDGQPYGPLDVQDVSDGLRLVVDGETIQLRVYGDGTLAAYHADGSLIDSVWPGYDGSILSDSLLLDAHIVSTPAGGFGIAEGMIEGTLYRGGAFGEMPDVENFGSAAESTGGAADAVPTFNPFESSVEITRFGDSASDGFFEPVEDTLATNTKKQSGSISDDVLAE